MFKPHHYLWTCLVLFTCIGPILLPAQIDTIPDIFKELITDKSRPNWLKLQKNATISKEEFLELIDSIQGGNDPSIFELLSSKEDKNKRIRHVYKQFYKGIIVEKHRWVLHEKNNKLFLAQGQFVKNPFNKAAEADLTKDQARIIALDQTRATKYAWEIPALEETLQTVKNNPRATNYPNPKLVWVTKGRKNKLQLAYKVKIYSVDPVAKKNYYIHAKTGEVLQTDDLLQTGCFEDTHEHHAHAATPENNTIFSSGNQVAIGTGIANYILTDEGEVPVNAVTSETGYTLYTDELGPSGNQILHTKNANNKWHYDGLTDFIDADNVWDTDPAAVGAHWGMEQVYDYYLDNFERKSFDDAGSPMINVVHYGNKLVNAYWDGIQMTYGDGDGTKWGALTSLDIIGHEFTHGVTEHNGTGGLLYIDDSGALNESFSDIFGAVIEFYYHPDGGDWMIGEDFDLANKEGFRNMADPHTKGHPKTYLGKYWYDSGGDNGGVHFNSGVQNYWFYLLSEGGSGTNEFGQAYDINPIGIDIAAQIAYYNLTRYMNPNSTYQDAKDGSIDAALLLYPTDLSIANTVEAAWCAVGIGASCGPTINVKKPTGQEVVTAGKGYELTWESELISASSKVKIEYATENVDDPIWTLAAEGVTNSGTFNWLVPSNYSGTVSVRITDDGDPTAGRVSNKDILGISKQFEIDACIGTNSFSGPTTAAVNETITFSSNITGDTYQWEIDGTVIATSPDLNYIFSEPGIYELTYTVTSAANGCFNEESRRLYVLGKNSNGFAIQVGDTDNGGGRAYAQEIFQTKDGGYIFTSLFTSLVFKFDASGQKVWTSDALPATTYGNYRMTGIEKSDGTLLFVMGHSPSGGAIAHDDLLLIEVDGNDGTIINNTSRRLSVDGRLIAHQIIPTDTSFIIGGVYQNIGTQHIFLVDIDASDYNINKQIWFGDDNLYDYYGDLLPTADGGYLMGWIQAGDYPDQFGLMKLDKDFQKEWQQGLFSYLIRPGLRSRINLLEAPNCGGYLILADADEYANSSLMKINPLGNILWAKRYTNPNALDGQLISFQKMVWDGNDGVTLLGINGSKLNSNNYPEAVDYQLLNVDFEGQMQWKRSIADLNLILPSNPSYNLYVADLITTADGGYLASIPGGDGGETHLIKTDSMGLDGCVTTNTTITEEDISTSFEIEFGRNATLQNPPIIQVGAEFPFDLVSPIIAVTTPACGLIGNELIAAFELSTNIIAINTAPNISNLSQGATDYTWLLNNQVVNFPLAKITTAGTYEITLAATDGTSTSQVSYTLQVVNNDECQLPCDLTTLQARTIEGSCPGSNDGQIYTEVTSPIGRTFKYNLYDTNGTLILTQATGFFTELATGEYQVKVTSDNDVSCVLDLGIFTLTPKVDNSPPKALCISAEVDVAFVHAAIGVPYNHGNYVNEMTAAFDQAWHQMTYETVDPERLFSNNYNYIYLEGSDHNAEELEEFLETNQSIIEEWVAAGNALFINAAPNEGDGMMLGFGGVELVRGNYTNALAVTTSMPMFTGPKTPVINNFSGFPYSKAAVIYPPSMTVTRILESSNGTDLLLQSAWGDGTVVFGGMNLTGFHTPSAETYNFKINLHYYLSSLPIATVNSPLPLELDATQSYTLSVAEIDLGSTDDCGLKSLSLNTDYFTCTDEGIVEVTLMVTDLADNISTCISRVEIINSPTLTKITIPICEGDTYNFYDQIVNTAGVYEAILQNQYACDSIIELTLSINPNNETFITASICQGNTYEFHDQVLTSEGTYSTSLVNNNGCDSLVTLTLEILPIEETAITQSICDGDFYAFHGIDLSFEGTYKDTLINRNGCDSLVTLTLIVLPIEVVTITQNICENDFYSFHGIDLNEPGIYIDTLTDINQCDSIIELTLSILSTSETLLTETICQGENIDFGTQNLTASGIYEKTLKNVYGCDSVVTMILMMEDCGDCPDNNLVLNGDPIAKNNYTAILHIESAGVVALDTVVYLAGRTINLNPGFLADNGSKFTAEIAEFICEDPRSIIAEAEADIFSQSRSSSGDQLAYEKEQQLQVNPNPFYQSTKINFSLATAQEVTLALYAADGQLLSILQSGYLPAGQYVKPFYMEDQSAGIFVVVLKTETEFLTQKIIRLK